jgi:hypothetical protein
VFRYNMDFEMRDRYRDKYNKMKHNEYKIRWGIIMSIMNDNFYS